MIAMIAAVSRNGVIGRGGGIPWRISADMQRFKALTTGDAAIARNTVIMGRRTWQGILRRGDASPHEAGSAVQCRIARPLPGRIVVVLSATQNYSGEQLYTARSLDEALHIAQECSPRGDVWLAGGERVYRDGLAMADALYITEVLADIDGDTYFPSFAASQYTIEESAPRQDETAVCDGCIVPYRFVTYRRARA